MAKRTLAPSLPPKPRDHWAIAQRFCVPAQRTRAPVQTCRDVSRFAFVWLGIANSLLFTLSESVSVARDWTSSDWRYTHTIGNPRAKKKNLRRHQCRSVVNANYYYRVYTNCRPPLQWWSHVLEYAGKRFASIDLRIQEFCFSETLKNYHSSCLLRLYKKFF